MPRNESFPQSELIPAIMLATLVALTGVEAYLIASPHRAVAHPAPVFAADSDARPR